jgi:putative ABC transport system ATP-binding protein
MLLDVRAVTKSFATGEGQLQVLKGISLSLKEGQSLALTGESGSGKSTLLHLVAGLDRPDRGEIWLQGRNIVGLADRPLAQIRRDVVGLVFQQFNLIPSLNAAANLAFHAKLANRHDAGWTKTLVQRLGLSDCLDRYPEQLSGGQQQRVAVGRTLAARPRLVLADEPTGNLDQATGDAVLDLMLRLVRETGTALLMATHSLRLAERFEARVRLRAGELV